MSLSTGLQREDRRVGASPDRGSVVYEKLRELITWGRIAPGARIIEAEVAARLDVSRTPVRAALQRLQQEGYVVAVGTGVQTRLSVAPLTQEDAHELFEIVGEVEGLAARRAAMLLPAARSRLIAELNELNANLLAASRAAEPDARLIFDVDQRFHRAWIDAAAGPRLTALHDAVKPQTDRYIRIYISALVDEIGTSVLEHDVTIRAIEAGQPDSAQVAVRTNWNHAAWRLARVIQSLGERGAW
ncbi:MAG: GntR family transcriptional regulator [Gemmatimonadetes bacterium]|nr:GntR family transcriptional regulator [Gemmatimonadota bacterium]